MELRRELQWSPRRLIAAFREEVGVTPKTFARIVRFETAQRELRAGRSPAAAAHAAGYADQSHLHRDFCAFAGRSPGVWRLVAGR